MVESVVVGIGLLVLVTVGCIGAAAWRFAATGDRSLQFLAGGAAAFAGVFVLGRAADLFRPLRSVAMAVLASLAAVALAVQWSRER